MILLALALAAAPTPPLTLAAWRALPPEDRPAILVAATEGVLLTTAGPHPETAHADPSCMSRIDIMALQARLVARAAGHPTQGLVDAFMEESGCSR